MRSVTGKNIVGTLFGESHGAAIGAVVDGLAPGIQLDLDNIRHQLARRRPRKDGLSTPRQEADEFEIVSGFFGGYTTGTPLCILIPNTSQRSSDYEKAKSLLRPSHADYTAQIKYGGYQDYRGGGHFSGRTTAPVVAVGAILLQVLEQSGIYIGTHILECHGVRDHELTGGKQDLLQALLTLKTKEYPTLSDDAWQKMRAEIEAARADSDSVGGILQSAVVGMPGGIGEPWFHSVESTLAALLYSVPAVKGVEFGLGFGFAGLRGSEANDPFVLSGETIETATNNNGGINGGITNGMPLLVNCAIRPTPSIGKAQRTVDIDRMEEATLETHGRHDPAILHRAVPVVDSVLAMGLADLLCHRHGIDWMVKGL